MEASVKMSESQVNEMEQQMDMEATLMKSAQTSNIKK